MAVYVPQEASHNVHLLVHNTQWSEIHSTYSKCKHGVIILVTGYASNQNYKCSEHIQTLLMYHHTTVLLWSKQSIFGQQDYQTHWCGART